MPLPRLSWRIPNCLLTFDTKQQCRWMSSSCNVPPPLPLCLKHSVPCLRRCSRRLCPRVVDSSAAWCAGWAGAGRPLILPPPGAQPVVCGRLCEMWAGLLLKVGGGGGVTSSHSFLFIFLFPEFHCYYSRASVTIVFSFSVTETSLMLILERSNGENNSTNVVGLGGGLRVFPVLLCSCSWPYSSLFI